MSDVCVCREWLVLEALSWMGTPYLKNRRLKSVGCDCATFIAEVLITCGLMPREDLGVYSHDWFQHTEEERYMFRLIRHAAKTMEGVAYPSTRVEPGNIVLSKVVQSRVYNHGGIVTRWPRVVQAVHPVVNEVDVTTDPLWVPHQLAIFDPWVKSDAR